ncbi:MAG: homoserine dehydrogenase [Lachnospiraceae bacterium]|nr:homoserine dehydrogenase [Lachnospiraceae bacterium]
MKHIAILGYGTIGSGVAAVLRVNAKQIAARAGEEIVVSKVLDLREFPGDPVQEILVHDYQEIVADESIDIVVETMGGVHPAFEFVSQALSQGRSVCSSNKELVASKGAELLKIAKEHNCNFFFEASVGGGIPIIRPLSTCLTADDIDEVSGILNGTTNFILTKMDQEGADYAETLKEAQKLGYAELHPEADVEGFDACRKIAILLSLVTGKTVNYEQIPTIGITEITAEDFQYAKFFGASIKLIANSFKVDDQFYAIVAPMLVPAEHPLHAVNDVFNGIFVHGNVLDNAMFYGRGAGKLPTASAVVADVIEAAKLGHQYASYGWSEEAYEIGNPLIVRRRFLVRIAEESAEIDEKIKEVFGKVMHIHYLKGEGSVFLTEPICEGDLPDMVAQVGTLISAIRVLD